MQKIISNIPTIKSDEDFSNHFDSNIWNNVALVICRHHNIKFSKIERAPSSDHVVFLIDNDLVLKIYRPFRDCFERELSALEFIVGKTDFLTPDIVQAGEFEGFSYLITTQIGGMSVTRTDWLSLSEAQQIRFIRKLAVSLNRIHQLQTDTVETGWPDFVTDRATTFVERQIGHGVNARIVEALPQFIEDNLDLVPMDCESVYMHADIHFGNLRILENEGQWEIAGLFDFADSLHGFHEYDFLAIGLLIMQGQKTVQREFFKAYGYAEDDLDESMRRRLMMLTMLYETSDLRRYAMRLKPEAVDFTIEELETGIWSFC